jgi:uncharacterized YccA/Bax inhibitor family protein
MRSSNPVLDEKVFSKQAALSSGGDAMTVEGSVNKTIILLFVLIGAAFAGWRLSETMAISPMILWGGGAIGGFVVAMITIFKPKWSAITAPVYGLLEGVFLGSISYFFNSMFEGIVMQAIGLTLGVLLLMLFLYKTRIIKVTPGLRLGIIVATGAIALLYLVSFILGFFGTTIPYIHSSSPIGIGFSVVVVGIAAFNLLLDFDFIEKGAEQSAPKYMEWFAAFSLMVTLVWLYLEILRLLAKLRR